MSSKRNGRSERAIDRLREGRKEEEERKDRKKAIVQRRARKRRSNGKGTLEGGPVCMHLGGPRRGPRRERDRRCGRDEARPSNAVRSVVARRTGASRFLSYPSSRVSSVLVVALYSPRFAASESASHRTTASISLPWTPQIFRAT